MFISDCKRAWFRVKLKLVVAVAYRPLVLTMSLIYIVLNADRGRHADALVSYTYLIGVSGDLLQI